MEDLISDDASPKRGKWTTEEDSILRQAVSEMGENRWKQISTRIGHRTPIQCLHRWTKTLKPGLTKGPWREEEDCLVIQWVQRNGPCRWAECAMGIGGRSGKQCRERWMNILDPGLRKGDWTAAEEETLFRMHRLKGGKWTEIANYLPGRSENNIKNHYYSTLRKSKHCEPDPPPCLSPRTDSSHSQVFSHALKLLKQLTELEEMLKLTYNSLDVLERGIAAEEQLEMSHVLGSDYFPDM